MDVAVRVRRRALPDPRPRRGEDEPGDHAPRWWERIWLRFSLLLRPGVAPRPLDDLIEPAGPHRPDIDGTAGAADRVPRRPPDKPLVGAVALPEPSSADEPDLRA